MKSGLIMGVLMLAAAVAGADFRHDLQGVKPWTDKPFLDDPQEFHFAVIADRTGGERKGFFAKAIDALNKLRPEFVMSVGDLIANGGQADVRKQWAEEREIVNRLDMPFFHVVGNHDIVTGFNGPTAARNNSIAVWKELHGTNTYYSFIYKNCLFVCMDSMETHDYFPPRESMSEAQYAWVAAEFERHANVRWRFIFMHKPIDWTSDRWLELERKLARYDYNVFCGDWHNHCTATRHGKKYYMIGTAGGGFDGGALTDDLRYGVMDSVTWVTMTKKGPVVANLALSGIHGDTIQTCATTRGWIETPLDYPSHLAESPLKYQGEKNSALIPVEVRHGPGYDWHFRHAVILRQGKVYGAKLEKFKPLKRRVVLLGDETASACAKEYGAGDQVFDMGFKGDRLENVMWRVIQGTLAGYAPQRVVISAGRHNQGVNTPEEIAAAVARLAALVRERLPDAEIILK